MSTFKDFTENLFRNVAAALDMPFEEAMRDVRGVNIATGGPVSELSTLEVVGERAGEFVLPRQVADRMGVCPRRSEIVGGVFRPRVTASVMMVDGRVVAVGATEFTLCSQGLEEPS